MDHTKKFVAAVTFLMVFGATNVLSNEHPVESHKAEVPKTADVHKVETKSVSKETCGVLHRFGGHVQVLSESLSDAVEAKVGLPILCDAWISVNDGWAYIQHRKGYQMNLGSESFAQIQSGEQTGTQKSDAWVLYRGHAYFKADDSQGELSVSTANARMRMTGGTGYLVYSTKEEETQFTSLTQTHKMASLENKHASNRKIEMKPGELTALNLKALRVVPSTPKVASAANLKARFKDLHIDEMDIKLAKEAVKDRHDRSIASDEPSHETKPEKTVEHPDEKDNGDADDNETDLAKKREAQKKSAKNHVPKKTAPKVLKKKQQKSEQRDPASEDTEKARLLQELMKIQPEDES